ncbi:MAG: NYN domain-containing protein [Tetrasphaera sp.]|nr:NYN domain-containing protein [Tetrasphaera sp.]
MRSYCAIYVDVGYLLASSATRVTGTSLRRGVTVDHESLIRGVIEQAEQDSGMPLLRVNWYDSGGRPGGMPDIHQEHVGLLPRVKLRLGRLSQTGEQKGVDLRMGLDLATYGRNRVVDVIYLISGDDDLTEAVEEAQFHGLQVVIMAVPDQRGRPHAVARNLQREADNVILIDAATIDAAVKPVALPPALIPGGEDKSVESASVAPQEDAPGGGLEPSAEGIPAPAASPDTTDRSAQPGEPAEPAAPHPNGARGTPAAVPSRPGPDTGTDADPGIDAEAPAPPHTAAPKPSVLAGKRPSTILPPKAAPPMWTTSTGGASRGEDIGLVDIEAIDAVVRQVIATWVLSATPEMLIELRKSEPFIPGDLDRTLLLDLSSRTGEYDINDASRHVMRDRFWEQVKRLRLG